MEYRNYFRVYDSFFTGALDEGYLLADRTQDAMLLAERALTLTRERGERGQEGWSLRLLGEIYSHGRAPDVEKARGSYDEARAVADTPGMRPPLAHCHFGLGKLYRTGDHSKTNEHLTTAATTYREVDMGFWLAQAEGLLNALVG